MKIALRVLVGGYVGFRGSGGGGSEFPGDPWVEILKTIDEDVLNSTTEQDDDELFFDGEADSLYIFELYVHYVSPATTTDIKTRVTSPADARGSWSAFGLSSTDAASAPSGALAVAPASVVFGTGLTPRIATYRGFAAMVTAGEIHYQWCQNTLDAVNPTTVLAGSRLRYWKQ